jgi:hexosaminidase
MRASIPLFLLLAACHGKDDPSDSGTPGTDDTGTPTDTATTPPAGVAIIPEPVRITAGGGAFTLGASTRIVAPSEAAAEATMLADALRPATGYPLQVVTSGAAAGDIVLELDTALDAEGYTLDVAGDGVTIAGGDAAGLFYGAQTLRQLLPVQVFEPTLVEDVGWEVPSVHIEDAPRFAWRGFSLDVARHFFTVEDVERQVDLIALHKMNRLHLHLTDDQGWRIEIPAWPRLTEVGGSTEVGGGEGGFYTQADYAEIVAYAAARHVTVVPEVDFPGHANAALASYGVLNPGGVPADLYTGEPVLSASLWLENDATWDFVEDVWTSLAAITPGGWVHVGGDEAIDTDPADYAEFLPWLQDVVGGLGKTLVGWDEIGEAELDPPFVAQHWYDEDRALASVDQGATLLSSPAEHTYLDMVYDDDAEFGQVWAGPIDVQRAYEWNPVLDGAVESDMMGVEGVVWTEFIDTVDKLDFMVWPRLACHAEVGWTAQSEVDWGGFRDRLAVHGARLDALGVAFYHSPEVDWVEPDAAR